MGFPKAVKDEVMAKSARRCAVCHQFKAVGVEVHHIKPKAQGGKDTIDNAIPLCFDCHCAAGHYNPKHPRGTKFSQCELRMQRDALYDIVKNGKHLDEHMHICDTLHMRHIVALDYDSVKDIIEMKFDSIPFKYKYLMKTKVLDLFNLILKDELPFSSRHSNDLSGFYNKYLNPDDIESIYAKYPGLRDGNTIALSKKIFIDIGIPSIFLKTLIDAGFPAENLGTITLRYEECGGSHFLDIRLRRPLFVFAELKNVAPDPVRIISIIHKDDKNLPAFIEGDSDIGAPIEMPLDNLTLMPNESMLIPECSLISPFESSIINGDYHTDNELSTALYNVMTYKVDNSKTDYYKATPFMDIIGAQIESQGKIVSHPANKFNLNKCYYFNRIWMCGSCPHVYGFDTEKKHWVYYGEIFSNSETTKPEQCSIPIDDNISTIRFVESDFEVSTFLYIKFNDNYLSNGPISIDHGEILEFDIHGPGHIDVYGFYDAVIRKPQGYIQRIQAIDLRRAYEELAFGSNVVPMKAV